MKLITIFFCTVFVVTLYVHAESAHEHSDTEKHTEEKHQHDEDKNTDHEEHADHDDEHSEHEEAHDDHSEHEEENSQVGADKGILEASEEQGIKLSPEAEKNFEIEKVVVTNSNSINISKNAIVTSGVEVNLYRYRDGFYKRIDFVKLSKNGNTLMISSKDLRKGDSIVTRGLGFILVAEIAAFGGAPEGHSH